jgi:hypothetical protein
MEGMADLAWVATRARNRQNTVRRTNTLPVTGTGQARIPYVGPTRHLLPKG